jgi:putative copper export protein
VLLVALFMPWFSGTVQGSNGTTEVLGSADGPRAHGYVWFVFALAIIVLIVIVARDRIRNVPGNLPSPDQMLVVATGLALLLTILAAVIKPSPSFDIVSSAGPGAALMPNFSFSVGFSYGGFIALAAAVVAFLAAFGLVNRDAARRGMPAIRRRPSTP